ncbi:hypothetical protein JZ751_027100 [Albula glossodonta]|uniref:Uncharacterized protein n=1 Tax=Albula glossodonta TaxID=121402 RepID=A0A8T2NCW8_9TELE|nr:hypothetical protein JZ751_027100 [Albula glossodonta]
MRGFWLQARYMVNRLNRVQSELPLRLLCTTLRAPRVVYREDQLRIDRCRVPKQKAHDTTDVPQSTQCSVFFTPTETEGISDDPLETLSRGSTSGKPEQRLRVKSPDEESAQNPG